MKKKILMFGSFVVDLMGRGDHLPIPGETVKAPYFKMGAGGKGFNQAIAAKKTGANIKLVTKLGKDTFADIAINMMKETGIDTGDIIWSEEHSTGVALIEVDESTGQNAIMVIPSACDNITDEEVDNLRDLVVESDIILMQLETNDSANERLIDMAHELDKMIVLNTAPYHPIKDEYLAKVSMVTPNEVEAEGLTGVKVEDQKTAAKAASLLHDKGIKQVIITMGSKGAFVSDGNIEEFVSSFKVKAIDTTGAGDAFNGGLVTALSEGKGIVEAARFASAVAALSVQKMGTSMSMPLRSEVDKFLSEV